MLNHSLSRSLERPSLRKRSHSISYTPNFYLTFKTIGFTHSKVSFTLLCFHHQRLGFCCFSIIKELMELINQISNSMVSHLVEDMYFQIVIKVVDSISWFLNKNNNMWLVSCTHISWVTNIFISEVFFLWRSFVFTISCWLGYTSTL